MENKRGLAKATGIVAIVFSSFSLLFGIIFMAAAHAIAREPWWVSGGWNTGWWEYRVNVGVLIFFILFGLIMMTLSIIQIVLSARLIRAADDLHNNPKACDGLLLAVCIMSLFSGGFVPFILAIIALCVNPNPGTLQSPANTGQLYCTQTGKPLTPVVTETQAGTAISSGVSELEALLARYKQYKTDGIITEEQYQQKVEEAIKNSVKAVIE